MRGVEIYLKDGTHLVVAGYASQVIKKINDARGTAQLIALERNSIPTGQMLYLDPNEVTLVKDET